MPQPQTDAELIKRAIEKAEYYRRAVHKIAHLTGISDGGRWTFNQLYAEVKRLKSVDTGKV